MALTFNNAEVKAITYGGKGDKGDKGDTLKITDVENAQRYKIYANGELKGGVDRNG